jgi:hypothetical protein
VIRRFHVTIGKQYANASIASNRLDVRAPALLMYPPMRMEMETNRLALRPWIPADAQWLNKLHRERDLPRGEKPPDLKPPNES